MSTNRNLQALLNKVNSFEELAMIAALEENGDQIIYIRKFAETGAVAAGASQDLWDTSGNLSYLSAADTLDVVSTSANDTLAGTGARIIRIQGLDGDYNLITEDVNMNGTSAVTTAQEFLRVFRVRMIFAGSGETNAGNISITDTTGGSTQGFINTGYGVSEMSHFTVPAGYTAISVLVQLSIGRSSGSGTREGEVTIKARVPTTGGLFNDYRTNEYLLNNQGSGLARLQGVVPGIIPEKTDYKFVVTSAQNNTRFTLQYELILIKDTEFANRVTII